MKILNVYTQNESTTEGYSEEKMALANRLMIAAISSNRKAEEYFKEYETKFKPDGAYSEWYKDMDAIVFLYK